MRCLLYDNRFNVPDGELETDEKIWKTHSEKGDKRKKNFEHFATEYPVVIIKLKNNLLVYIEEIKK